jgi:putative transposase
VAKKKVAEAPVELKRAEVEPDHPRIPVTRQCDLLDLPRSCFYYLPAGEDDENQGLMRLIDEQFTKTPFYGVRRMTAWLRRQGHPVNRKRIRRLMRLMGLMAIYPKPRLSVGGPDHKIYPYLLKGLKISRPDQAWCADITYIRLAHGFVYLVVILDWHSRYVLSWELSTTLDKGFCLDALRTALGRSKPEIFNTDQGAQFTSAAFVGVLEAAGIRVSMDGRGRVYDNIFVERFWRSVKYEEVYLSDYRTVPEARAQLGAYFRFYNEERPHEALGYRTPQEVYYGTRSVLLPASEAVV